MKTEHEMVREFMRAFGQRMPERAALPDVNTMELRADLIREELEELVAAYTITDYFDAILDLLYVVHGAAAAAGITAEQLEAGFAEVHRSNMSKMWTVEDVATWLPHEHDYRLERLEPDLYIVRRADGKVVKSPSYSPANLGKILEGWR